MNLKSALIATVAISSVIRLIFAGLLISASYELNTYALRLAFMCLGLGLIVLTIARIGKFWRVVRKMSLLDE